MGQTDYTLSTLTRLCDGDIAARLPWHILKDDGLWLADPYGLATPPHLFPLADREVLQWHPWQDTGRPALPLPFKANELAAFTLAGGGYFLLERFDTGNELDEAALTELGANADMARDVLREAHRLRQLAAEKFGRDDDGIRQSARWLLSEANNDGLASPTSPAPATPALIQRQAVQVMTDNERRVKEAIAAELAARGIDTVPPAEHGNKPDPFKATVEVNCGLGSGAFKHAWDAVTKGMRTPKRRRT